MAKLDSCSAYTAAFTLHMDVLLYSSSGSNFMTNLMSCSLTTLTAEQVQATVNFSIKPLGSQPSPFPMTAQPSQLIIPANESRFMAVHFAPAAIRSYIAVFEAMVENGGDAATRSFSCELRGEGTLPSLTLELPQADKGPQALRFPRLLMVRLGEIPSCSHILPLSDNFAPDLWRHHVHVALVFELAYTSRVSQRPCTICIVINRISEVPRI